MKAGIMLKIDSSVFNDGVTVCAQFYEDILSKSLTLCVPCIILQCVNNQRDAQFLQSIFIPQFLSALHVSNEI